MIRLSSHLPFKFPSRARALAENRALARKLRLFPENQITGSRV
jgi:hypothetical protein